MKHQLMTLNEELTESVSHFERRGLAGIWRQARGEAETS
jgi:hypothetical protein